MPMLILLFFMVPMDMACLMLAMLDTDMGPMAMVLDPMDMAMEDSLIWERGPLMLSLMPMLILLFFMVPMDMACLMSAMLDTDMGPMAMVLDPMDMAMEDSLIWERGPLMLSLRPRL